ncbi:MAG: Gliding motility-associated C-terminal protein [Frankiales bacterium]|nr:Gliding motility-associated C-terminal protein [Frankiales bacterium]
MQLRPSATRGRLLAAATAFTTVAGVTGTALLSAAVIATPAASAATAPTVGCTSGADRLNTGHDSLTGGTLSNGQQDATWTVVGPVETGLGVTSPKTKALQAPTTAVPKPALVGKAAAVYVDSPYGNAQWISQEGVGGSSPDADWWYTASFELSPEVDASTFALKLNFYADNSVNEVYVNGAAQSGLTAGLPSYAAGTDPYQANGFSAGRGSNTTLKSDWQAGHNTIQVQIKSGANAEGFLAQVVPFPTCTVTVQVRGSQTYGGSDRTLTWQASGGPDPTGTLSCAVSPTLPVSKLTLDTSSCTGLVAPAGYALRYVGGNDAFVVNRAALTVTPAATSAMYGSSPTVGPVYSGFVNGEGPAKLTTQATCGVVATSVLHVGGHPTACSGASAANYTVEYKPGTATITRAPLAVTASSSSAAYGTTPDVTAAYEGFAYTDSAASLTTPASCTTTATAASLPGVYPTTCSGAVSGDYDFSYSAGKYTVGKGVVTVTASSPTMTYGSDAPAVTPSYAGFVGDRNSTSASFQSPTCTTTAGPTTHVADTAPITTCSGAKDPAYDFVYVPGRVSVQAAAVTLTADDASKVYGDAVRPVGSSAKGLKNDQTSAALGAACATAAMAGSPVLPAGYATTCSGATNPDYDVTYVPGTLTVTPRPLTITASAGTMVYGGTVPDVAASYTLLFQDTLDTEPVCRTAATSSSNTGDYTSSCDGAEDTDYAITYATGTTQVMRAPLTIGADSVTITYGDALPTFTPKGVGFVNGDTTAALGKGLLCDVAVTGIAPVTSDGYPITCGGGVTGNYEVATTTGTLTVAPKALTITASSPSSVYGATVPVVVPLYSGLTAGDTAPKTAPSCSSTVPASGIVGTYPASCAGAADSNYAIDYAGGTQTVTRAPVVVTASSPTGSYLEPVPAVLADYVGLAKGQTVPTTAATCSSTATTTSAPGTYPTTCKDTSDLNHSFTYKPGVLTIRLVLGCANSAAYGTGLDWHGRDLRGKDLGGISLRGMNLAGANLQGVNLAGADLTGANLQGADLRGVNLSGANLSGVNLVGANLTGTNLKGARLTCANLQAITAQGANLAGTDMTDAKVVRASLTGANLVGANLTRASFRDAVVKGGSTTSVLWRSTTCTDGRNSDDVGGTCVGHW